MVEGAPVLDSVGRVEMCGSDLRSHGREPNIGGVTPRHSQLGDDHPGGLGDEGVVGGGVLLCRGWTARRATIGARSGGQITAMSLRVPYPPVPVLSPTTQPAGTPARTSAAPVVLPRSQPMQHVAVRRFQGAPTVYARRSPARARAVLVSRLSPGVRLVQRGLVAGRVGDRVAELAQLLLELRGPPRWRSSRLPAVLSL